MTVVHDDGIEDEAIMAPIANPAVQATIARPL